MLGLPLGVDRIVKRAHHLGQKLDGDAVIEVVVEGQGAEDLFGGEAFLVHFIIIKWV